jgi:tetratricopeptide (TPR) repeat protein/transcriptional regulator with XRE-family HTH domain
MVAESGDGGLSGVWLRQSRVAAGLTQERLAARSGVSVRTISDLERGVSVRPYPRSIRLLAEALALPVSLADEVVASYRRNGTPASRRLRAAEGDPSGLLALGGERNHWPAVPRQLPADLRQFAGRSYELSVLDRLLTETDQPGGGIVICAIDGTAGVGKTTLAVHWAHQAAPKFPDGQLYVNLRGFGTSGTPAAPAEVIRDLLEALGAPAGLIPASPEARAALYRTLAAGRRLLILLDNAHDTEQVRPLLPAGPDCLVLITSRSQLTGLAAAEGAHRLTVDLLTEEEARQLLALRLGAARIRAEPTAVAELIELCARLPLALAIASARPRVALSTLTAELRDTGARLDALDTGNPTTSIRTVFSWSYQQLSPAAARMFRLLSLHPGPDFTMAAAGSLAGDPAGQTRQHIGELTRAHLIAERIPGRYALHDLLRVYAAEQASGQEPETGRRAAVQRMLDHYLHAAHAAALVLEPHRDPLTLPPLQPGAAPDAISDDQHAMAWFAAEHQVLTALFSLGGNYGLDRYDWQLPAVMATYFERRGAWSEYAAIQRTALAAASRAGDVVGQAITHAYLIHISSVHGSYDQARWHFEQALPLFRQDGGCLTGEARAHLAIGHALGEQGDHREAMAHAKSALELYRAAGHQGGEAVALHNIGWTHSQLGDNQQALAGLQQALALFRALGHQPGQAAAWGSLGHAHSELGQNAEAIDCYSRAVELDARLGDRWEQAAHLHELGRAQNAAHQAQAAIASWQEAIEILDAIHDPNADKLRAQVEQAQTHCDHHATHQSSARDNKHSATTFSAPI